MSYKQDETGKVWREAVDEHGVASWHPTELTEVPTIPEPGSKEFRFNPKSAMAAKYNQASANTRKAAREIYEGILDERGFGAQAKDKWARELGFLDRNAIAINDELTKLGAGAMDISDFVLDSLGDEGAAIRSYKRSERMSDYDEEMKEILKVVGFEPGAMLPYMLDGIIAGPAARKVSGELIKKGQKVAGAAAHETGGLITRGVNRLAEIQNPIGRMGAKAKREITDPLNRMAMRKRHQLPEVDPFRKGMLTNTVADMGIGGAEGAVHYDRSIASDAGTSAIGSLVGGRFGRPLTRSPNYYKNLDGTDSATNDLINWGKDRGLKFMPGLETGSNAKQMFEAGIRADTDWTDALSIFDRNNDRVMGREVFRAAGVGNDIIDTITPKQLSAHRASLSAEYQALEAGTKGKFDFQALMQVRKDARRLGKSSSKEARSAYNEVQATLKEFNDMYQPNKLQKAQGVRNKIGAFDGQEYQRARKKLKATIDGAVAKGNFVKSDALKPLLYELDSAMERGIREMGGEANVKAWKELNERFALSDMVMKHGMGINNNIDMGKMSSYLMDEKNAIQTLTEAGERIIPIQKMAKLHNLARGQKGSPLTGHNMHGFTNPERVPMWHKLLMTQGGKIPLIPKTYMGLYKRGIPSTKGWLNMNAQGSGLSNPSTYGRAFAQASQIHPTVVQGLMEGGKMAKGAYDKAEEGMIDFKEWLKGRDEGFFE